MSTAATRTTLVVVLLGVAHPSHGAGLTSLLTKERSLWTTMEQITSKLVQAEGELSRARGKARQLDYRHREAQRRSKALRKGVQERRKRLRGRLVALYKLVQGRHVQLLMDTESWAHAIRRAGALRQVVRHDLRELALFRKELAAQERIERETARERSTRQARLTTLRSSLQALATARAQKSAQLDDARYDRRRLQKKKDKVSRRQRALLREITRVSKRTGAIGGFVRLKGRLATPVHCGRPRGHGAARDKATRQLVSRPGYSYRCSQRRRVYAVAGGRVRLAGKLPGYGEMVLIDHGAGYYSLYAHLEKLRVKKGQVVHSRDRLGITGIDPLSQSRGLYFELRHREFPLNPKVWLRR